jgi:rhamnosyltransferase
MEYAVSTEYNYFLFCDQDDYWIPEKLKKNLSKIKDLEKRYLKKTPILIHSDLEVVDRRLKQIHPSFTSYQGIRNEPEKALNVLLVQNFATGCSMIFNRSLLEISLPLPEGVIMHDWWVALCAAVFGKIGFIDEKLVKYLMNKSGYP